MRFIKRTIALSGCSARRQDQKRKADPEKHHRENLLTIRLIKFDCGKLELILELVLLSVREWFASCLKNIVASGCENFRKNQTILGKKSSPHAQ